MVLPATHDRVGQKARTGQATRNGKLGCLADKDLGGLSVATFQDELRLDHSGHDDRGRPTLDDLGDLLADLVERVEALAFDLLGHDFDLDARQMIGNRLATRRLLALVVRDHLRLRQVAQIGFAVLGQHCVEYVERQLRLVGQALRLLAAKTELELAAGISSSRSCASRWSPRCARTPSSNRTCAQTRLASWSRRRSVAARATSVLVAPGRHVLFEFTPKHDGDAVDAVLAGYEGCLVADAHVVYDHLYEDGAVTEVNCWAHCQRRAI